MYIYVCAHMYTCEYKHVYRYICIVSTYKHMETRIPKYNRKCKQHKASKFYEVTYIPVNLNVKMKIDTDHNHTCNYACKHLHIHRKISINTNRNSNQNISIHLRLDLEI